MQVFVERLEHARCRDGIPVAVNVLGVVGVGWKVAPEDVDGDPKVFRVRGEKG